MVFGIGIGYGLDFLFNTFPIFLVIFSLLGFAAGIKVMLQTANQINIVKDQSKKAVNKVAEAGEDQFNIHPMDQFIIKPFLVEILFIGIPTLIKHSG